MSKKSFSRGFDLLLGEDETPKVHNEPNNTLEKEPEIRATFQITPQQFEDIKAIAYWERKKMKDLMKEVFSLYINEYKKEKGEIKKTRH